MQHSEWVGGTLCLHTFKLLSVGFGLGGAELLAYFFAIRAIYLGAEQGDVGVMTWWNLCEVREHLFCRDCP